MALFMVALRRTTSLLLSLVIGLTLSLGTRAAQAANIVVVTPSSMGTFATYLSSACGEPITSAVDFVNGPATPPIGTGSFRYTIGTNGNSAADIRTSAYNLTRLDALTTLTYSTYVTHYIDVQAPYLILNLDNDGDASTVEDQLFFEPTYQAGSSSIGSPAPITQPALTTGVWQTWDALHGGWWSNFALLGSGGGPPVFTIAYYLTLYPDARIVSSQTGPIGGLRIRAGCGEGSWDNFDGNSDNLTVGVNGNNTTYNFDLVAPPSGSSSGASVSFPQAASVPLCSLIDGTTTPFIRASVPNGAATYNGIWANVYCGVLTDPVQYGVFDRQVIHAVEVFALTSGQPTISVTKFNAPVLLCLQGSGTMLYRDATGIPRVVTELPSFAQGDFTCANLPNAGTAILVVGTPNVTAPSTVNDSAASLDLCEITTRGILNLRQTPDSSGAVLDRVPNATTLKASAKQGDWFQVVFGSNQGWISAGLVDTDRNCG